ncbi:hypothetical protein Tco_0814707 [Tanacetum coccineum]
MKRKDNRMNDEQPYKRICKAEKFEAIKYSLGPNEEYIDVSSLDMALPPRYQIHQYLRFEGLGYTNADITDFEERLCRIYGREIHRVRVFNFEGFIELMAEGLSGSMLMEHMDAQG